MPVAVWGSITDVPGVRVGQATRAGGGALTGVTVVLPPRGTIGAVDVRGGGPATHETDALDPTALVPTVDGVCLTGGSAFGLAAAGGVARWLEERGEGFPVGPPGDPGSLVVPIVPAAACFDLGRGGDPLARPDAELGRLAAEAAGTSPPERGAAGAGTGTLLAAGRLKGGVGTACVRTDGGLLVGAVAVVNAVGDPVDHVSGGLLGAAFVPPGLPRPSLPGREERAALAAALTPISSDSGAGPRVNTTLAVVATNAAIDPATAKRTAAAAHDGLARSLVPVHTLADGDVVFTLATGQVPVHGFDVILLQAAAADAVLLAVLDAVLTSTRTPTAAGLVPGYTDLCPSVTL